MSTVRVTFLPSGISGDVPRGTTLLEAAIKLDVPLRHVCGGQANCTTCRVRTVEARLSAPNDKEKSRLPEVRLEGGWRLSCQSRLLGDTTVRVPTLLEWLEETHHG